MSVYSMTLVNLPKAKFWIEICIVYLVWFDVILNVISSTAIVISKTEGLNRKISLESNWGVSFIDGESSEWKILYFWSLIKQGNNWSSLPTHDIQERRNLKSSSSHGTKQLMNNGKVFETFCRNKRYWKCNTDIKIWKLNLEWLREDQLEIKMNKNLNLQ